MRITVVIGKEGIERAWSSISSVADGKLAAEILEVASLGLRLIHDSIREHFGGTEPVMRTFRAELLDEIETILAEGNASHSPLRAVMLVEHLGWGEWLAVSYEELKKKIVETRESGNKVDPISHEDFLLVIGIFYRQVREADNGIV